MRYSEFKKIAKKKDCHLLIDLNELEQVKEGQKILVNDPETVRIEEHNNYYHVRPIAVRKGEYNQWYVYFVCPCCGEIHVHGLDRQETEKGVLPVGKFSGSRSSHCNTFEHCGYHFDLVIA